MDSGNSGSLQSSSGGDEEFDSRTESISSFLNSSAFNQPLPTAAPPPQQQQHHHHNQQLLSHQQQQGGNNFFGQNLDPFQLPNHFSPQNHNQQNQSHDLLWARNLRPDSGSHVAQFGGINPQSVLNNSQLTQQQSLPPPQQTSSHLPADANAAAKGGAGGGENNNHQPATAAVKNPKKRTRASRRAPTTVLTTDTTNFRQMVQEFTGIPTAPFSGAGGSPYARGRLDLFSTGTSNMGPLYPLRPSAQKAQHHQNSFIDSANSQNHLLNMQQNHILSFNPNNPNPNPNPINHNNIPSFLLAGKNPGMMNNNVSSNNVNTSSLPSYDELGLGQNVNAAGAHVSSGLWRDSGATAAPAHVSGYAAAPEFLQHEKGNLENVTSGGEGTVGSWICPSD